MPYANRGLAYFRSGDFNHAMADFDEAIRIGNFTNNHDRSVIFMNRCAALNRNKNYVRAIEDCTEAISAEKTNAKAYSDRGNSYYGSVTSIAPWPISTSEPFASIRRWR